MADVKIWVPPTAERVLRQQRRQQFAYYYRELSSTLRKALQAEGEFVPRKILPPLGALGVYHGLAEIHKATDRTFEMLRLIGGTAFIRAIVDTRIRHVQRYAKPPRFRGDTGYVIEPRDKASTTTAGDQRRMAQIDDFLQNGGLRTRRDVDGAFGVWSADGYDEGTPLMDALAITVRDTLTLDAAGWWLHPSRDPNIPCTMFRPLDAALLRRCLPPVPEGLEVAGEGAFYTPYEPVIRRGLPAAAFVMVDPNGQPIMEFARDEIAYLVRNPRSDWWTQGYGYAELESMIEVVVGLLTAVNYNVSYFTESHIPPAILFGTGEFSDEWLEDFFSTIASQVGGPNKWHKLPALFGDEGARLELIPLRSGQREDMMWREWLVFLINLACASFHIAAEEIGFQAFLTRGGVLTQAAGAERVTQAQDTGLRPLLYQLETFIDRHIVSRFWPDPRTGIGPYRFRFVGVDEQDEQTALQLDSMAVNVGLRTVNEVRIERGLPPYRDPLDDRLWSDCEDTVRKHMPELERYPEAFREKVEALYRRAGGAFARWPDAPGNPTLLQIWLQEHQADIAAQQQEEYGPETAGLGLGAQAGGGRGENAGPAEALQQLAAMAAGGGGEEPQEGAWEAEEGEAKQPPTGLWQRMKGAAKSVGNRVIEVFVRRGR